MVKRRKSSSRTAECTPAPGTQRTGSTASGGSSGRQRTADVELAVTQLNAGQSIVFSGQATLMVQEGALWVFGKKVTAASGDLELCARGPCCAALLLESLQVAAQVPLRASNRCTFSLTRSPHAGLGATTTSAAEQQESKRLAGARSPQTAAASAFSTFPASEAGAPLCLSALPEWRSLAANLSASVDDQQQPSLLVCGSKQTGKSTLAQLLVNSLLNTHPVVAFLDTDSGQPEFTPPGIISVTLLQRPFYGSPHEHQLQPSFALFVGDVSAQSHPPLYVACVGAAFKWFRSHGAAASEALSTSPGLPPLVINTPGWVKGIGLDMLADSVRTLQPSHVLQLQSRVNNRNLPESAWWRPQGDPGAASAAPAHHLLPAHEAVQDAVPSSIPAADLRGSSAPSRVRTPVESRALSWLAFARGCLLDKQAALSIDADAASFAEVAHALAAELPYVIALDDLQIQVLHAAMSPGQVPYALAGAIVGLATAALHGQPLHSMDAVCGHPEAAPLACHGLGIVRSVDVEKGLLYLLTPLPEDTLQLIDVLQVGRLELPPALLQAPGLLSPYMSLFSLTADGSGARIMKSRGNLQRQGQHAA